jgi:hypothetical protein
MISITKVTGKVKAMLERYPTSRDNDNELIARIWWDETPNPGTCSLSLFLRRFTASECTSPESIRRTRQKLQEKIPGLRGVNYTTRANHRHNIRRELGYNTPGI